MTTVETQFMSREEKANRSGMHQIEPILSKSRMFEMGLMNTGSRQRVLARVSGGVGFGQMVGRRQVARLAPEHPQLVSHPDPLLCIRSLLSRSRRTEVRVEGRILRGKEWSPFEKFRVRSAFGTKLDFVASLLIGTRSDRFA